ncbi:MAG: recombination protein O N-terminal domain-containing protein [Patescibacteria group bacterium]
MTEFVTRAFVLGKRVRGELDLTVDLYTESMGRIEGRVISGQKISSRFSPHLNIFNLVTIRMVEKNTLTVTDVLTVSESPLVRNNPSLYEGVLSIFFLLRVSTPPHVPDPILWEYLTQSMSSGAIEMKEILKILGHDISSATCAQCKKASPRYFEYEDGIFFCETCGSKQARDKVVLIV